MLTRLVVACSTESRWGSALSPGISFSVLFYWFVPEHENYNACRSLLHFQFQANLFHLTVIIEVDFGVALKRGWLRKS
jgi:hypothetical protein